MEVTEETLPAAVSILFTKVNHLIELAEHGVECGIWLNQTDDNKDISFKILLPFIPVVGDILFDITEGTCGSERRIRPERLRCDARTWRILRKLNPEQILLTKRMIRIENDNWSLLFDANILDE